jgi:hypothetical protein
LSVKRSAWRLWAATFVIALACVFVANTGTKASANPEAVRETIVFERFGLVMKLDTMVRPPSAAAYPGVGDRHPHIRVYRNGRRVIDATISSPWRNDKPTATPMLLIAIKSPGHALLTVYTGDGMHSEGRAIVSYPVEIDEHFRNDDPYGSSETTAYGSEAVHVVTVDCSPIVATYVYRRPPQADGRNVARLTIERNDRVVYRGPISHVDDNLAPLAFGCIEDGKRRDVFFNGRDYTENATSIRYFDSAKRSYSEAYRWWGVLLPEISIGTSTRAAVFRSRDLRIYRSPIYRSVASPVRVETFEHHEFHDITREFPLLIKRDIAALRRQIIAMQGHRSDPVFCEALLADEMNIGDVRADRRFLSAHCPNLAARNGKKVQARLHALGYP